MISKSGVSRSPHTALSGKDYEMVKNFEMVSFITETLTHYRIRFHVLVRNIIGSDIIYTLVYGSPDPNQRKKNDTSHLDQSVYVHNKRLELFSLKLVYQPVANLVFRSNLTILGQENKQLLNYILQLIPRPFRPKIAFFGHGRNFQARNPNSLAERWKRFWATKVDWWFAYTEETKRYLVSIGFPEERITVFNNSIDTSELARQASELTPERLAGRRAELGLVGRNTCVYVGGLYPDKRVPFLIEALDLIRAKVPDFEFVAVGGGVDLPLLQEAAASRRWLKVTGPKFGADKVELMAFGKLFLIPGLVGLAVLDAGVMGLPVVTTDFPYHSPEIAYLEDGRSGLIVRPWTDAGAYAHAVIDLLTGDPARLTEMAEASRAVAAKYTIEAMAENFTCGVLKALGRTPSHTVDLPRP
jgi:glycosyltransferase involved in cell wall biosynthesis